MTGSNWYSAVGDCAVIGLSRSRENRIFEGLKLNERLAEEGVSAKYAICVVNLEISDVEQPLEMEGVDG